MSGLGALAALVATAPTRSETPTHLWGEVVATDPPTVILEHDTDAEPREVSSVAVSRLAVGSRVRLELLGQRLTILGPEAPAPPPPAATRGSNANGNWWRHPSGLQVCWTSYSGTGSTSPYGALHLAGSQWNFPLPFLDIPTVTCGQFRMGTGAAMIGSPLEVTRTSVRLTGIDVVARPPGTPVQIQARAVGLYR